MQKLDNLLEIQKIKHEIDQLRYKIEEIEKRTINKNLSASNNITRRKLLTLYIYADEALFENNEKTIILRSNAVEFLKWAKIHFECAIITNNPRSEIKKSLEEMNDWLKEIKVIEKNTLTTIDDVIDTYKDFYIISTETLRGPTYQLVDISENKRYIKLNKKPLDQAQIKLFKRLNDIARNKMSFILNNIPNNIKSYSILGNENYIYRNFTYGKQYTKGYIELTIQSLDYSLITKFTINYYIKQYESKRYTLYTTSGLEEFLEKIENISDIVLPIISTGDISSIVSEFINED
ncbi:hypothetical protein [Mesobacillus jeotgali]|uniref:hypothetical protein n=1 Tax=Mesobacillus jeotgali TaxID=129985 RepID=UPI001784E67C|nr:hypothetical protein [Mesobacillus jeotgali]UYZ21763.1 Eisosome component PIL1/LSP1 family protein [Mesobacillus jeotgali]